MKSFIRTADGVSMFIDGKILSAENSHPKYNAIIEALRDEDWDAIPSLINTAVAVEQYAQGSGIVVDVDAAMITYNGVPLRNYLVDRILSMLSEGFNIAPMVTYLENLMSNPSKRAVDELHKFNEYGKMPITEDGCFIAYKIISGWYDTYTKTVFNKPAALFDADDRKLLPYTTELGVTVDVEDGFTTVSMPRNQVDANAARTCSEGLHFCSQEYLESFSGDKIVVLKINPADVVSIPIDYNNTKGRCWKYQVVDVLSDEDFKKAMGTNIFTEAVYTALSDIDDIDGWDDSDIDGWDDIEYEDDWREVEDLVPGVVLDAGKVVDALQPLITPVAAASATPVSDKSGSFVTQDFIAGYLAGYKDGRYGDGRYYSDGVGAWHAGYAEGWKDGKAHKAKRFK